MSKKKQQYVLEIYQDGQWEWAEMCQYINYLKKQALIYERNGHKTRIIKK